MHYNKHIVTTLYYGMRVLVVIAVALFLWNQDWVDAVSAFAILVLMLLPELLRKWHRLYLPFELELGITAFVFVALFLGSLRDFYERFSWWDPLLHFQSGILLALVGFVLVYLLNVRKVKSLSLSPFFVAFFAACFAMAIGVVWEIYEYILDTFFGFTMQENGLVDTMSDMILNTAGAFLVAIVSYIWMRFRMRIPFTPRRLAGSKYDPDK